MRIQNSRGYTDHFREKLEPLARGYPVALSMDEDRYITQGKIRRKVPTKTVLLAPGELYGMRAGTVVVSVLGKGSCVVTFAAKSDIANLVLAGMPAPLATTLMNQLHQIFGDRHHGNCPSA